MTDIIPIGTDYTPRDKAGYFDRAVRAALSVFPNWTETEAASFIRLFLESGATIGGLISYYENRHAREAHLVTAVDRTNAVRHARKFDYTPRRRTASRVDLVFTLAATATNAVTFPAGSIIRSKSVQNVIATHLLTDLTIPVGSIDGTVTAENSEPHPETYEPTTQPSQRFPLSFSPFVAIDTFADSVSSDWAEVVNFRDSGSGDFHYRLLLNTENEATIEFGDGVQGKLPVGLTSVTYRSGGGEVEIAANEIEVAEFTVTDDIGNPVQFTVTNPLAGTTGQNEETVAELQENVPASIRAVTRTVALEDYSINAKDVEEVARAMLLTSDQDGTIITSENYGQLYIVAVGARYYADGPFQPATPTQATLDAVALNLTETKPKTVTFRLDVLAYIQEQVDITARVKLQQGANASDVDTAIRRNLQDFFAPQNADGTENDQIDFGFNYRDADGNLDNRLAWSDIFNAVRDATGVRSVDNDTFIPVDDVVVPTNAFPVLGTITIINDATGLPLV
jgi:hypothetical protein